MDSIEDIDVIEDIVNNDMVRYKKKGWGLLVAIAITVAFFSVGPILGILYKKWQANNNGLLLWDGLITMEMKVIKQLGLDYT